MDDPAILDAFYAIKQSIDGVTKSLDLINAKLALIVERMEMPRQEQKPAPTQNGNSKKSLYETVGNWTAGFDPRAWEGKSMKGRPLRDCPVPFLKAYAAAKRDMASGKAERDPAAAAKQIGYANEIDKLAAELELL